MTSKLLVSELVDILKKIEKNLIPVKGRVIGNEILPIYSIGFIGDIVNLTVLYKEPWPGAEKNVYDIISALESYVLTPKNKPNGDSIVVLAVERNLMDYGVEIKSYSIEGVSFEDEGVLISAGPEEIAMKRKYPADPYLLEMQKKEPSNPFYFPFRPGVDKK